MNHPPCTHNFANTSPRAHQAGAALFIALILLVIIAIIGVSGVRSVVMEKSMATNKQYYMLVFQAAETAIEGTLADATAFVDAINTPLAGTWPTRTFAMTQGTSAYAVSSDASIAVGTPTIPIGYSIGEFVTYPFTITADGAIAAMNAADTHVLTATKIAPLLR